MRHDTRLLYLCHAVQCPAPVSVRLPVGSCARGCFFCCKNSWRGGPRYSLRHAFTNDDFLRLWERIIIKNDFRFVWPQRKILGALKLNRMLRFVREDLFEPAISDITKRVLKGCHDRDYGIIVKTSSVNVVKHIPALKKIRHCIVFSITDLLDDYMEKVEAVNELVGSGLKVTLSLKPIFE